MERKITELKLNELQTVAGGYSYSMPAATVAKQPTYSGLLSGVSQPVAPTTTLR